MGGRPAARMLSAHGAVRLGVLMLLLLLFMLLLLLPLALAKPSVSHAESSWWVPAQSTTWQWQLDTANVDQSVEAQMYDVDLFETSAEVVSSLHAQGRHVICYLDAGTWEEWRPDAKEFPSSVLGNVVSNEYGNERWLDISQLSVIEPIMKARLEMCKQKGFDGVEADNVEGFEVDSGFPLTAAEQLTYNEWLANTAHSLGLSIALKNDRQQAAELEPYFDFALDEECFQSEECGKLEPFTTAGKAVFEVEYNLQPSQFCEQANAAGYMAMVKTKELTAARTPCWPQAQGDWVGAKGAAGYDLGGWGGSNDVSYFPGATATLTKGSRYVWSAPATETRALESPSGSGREAATYYDPNQIEVQLRFTKEYKGSLHLYALDWDSQGRRETITADGQSATLSSDFTQGAWVSFQISAAAGQTIPITVTRTAGSNAVLSGIFLGEAGAPPAPTVESAPKGTWVKAVGSAGYDLAGWNGAAGDLAYMPDASLSVQQGSRWQWAQNTTDTRALQSPDGLTRSAATYYDPNQIQMQLSFNEAYSGNLHLYAVDWDSQNRRETITVNGQSVTLGSDFSQGAWVSLPISVAAKGTVSITVTRLSGGSAVLSGIFLGDAGAPPAPKVESAPQGTWVNAVGSAGYALTGWNGANGDLSYLPNATLTLNQGSRYEWAANTTDPRALSDPAEHTRNAGTYYDPNEIKLTLSFAAAYSGNLHLYAVDWDSQNRRETITVNGQSVTLGSDFSQGAWVSLPISVAAKGTVSITVTRLSGGSAVLSGIFLGDAGAPPAPKVESAPQGTWVNAVGSAGYALTGWNGANGDLSYLPNATLTLNQGSRYEWAANTTDPRALSDPAEHTRNAGTYYDPNQIQMQLSFSAAYTGSLHLYALDWDSAGRREVITVNGQSVALSSDFSQGAWVSFPINVEAGATVPITVTRLAGSNAVLSGIFLGEAGPPPGPTVTSAPQGTWVGEYGTSGYALAAWNGASDLTELPKATLTVEQASRYVWASSTTDVRALESPDTSTREAATYYDPHEIKLRLSFPGAYSGDLHLYAVDWDSQGRREIITVNGESAVLSSDFTNGAWVSFPISVAPGDAVSITVTSLAGGNAVLSGIFLG